MTYEKLLIPPSAAPSPVGSTRAVKVTSATLVTSSQEALAGPTVGTITVSSRLTKAPLTMRYNIEAQAQRRANFAQSFGTVSVSTDK